MRGDGCSETVFLLISDDIYRFIVFVTGIQSVAQAGLGLSSSCYSLLSELYTYTPTSNNFTMSFKKK